MSLWKPIRGYEELYLISDEGEVYALPREIFNGRGKYFREGRKIKPYLRGRDGMKYYAICLCRDGIEERLSIHRLVAEAFVDNDDPLNHSVINHKDRNTLNTEQTTWSGVTSNITLNMGTTRELVSLRMA